MNSFRKLCENIQGENPYASFFAGDINEHSQEWYPDGNTNAEGLSLNELFNDLQLHQLIKEPTHFLTTSLVHHVSMLFSLTSPTW